MVSPRVFRTDEEYFSPIGIILREESEEMRKERAKRRNKESLEREEAFSKTRFLYLSFGCLFYSMVHLTLFTTANFGTEESGRWQVDCGC